MPWLNLFRVGTSYREHGQERLSTRVQQVFLARGAPPTLYIKSDPSQRLWHGNHREFTALFGRFEPRSQAIQDPY